MTEWKKIAIVSAMALEICFAEVYLGSRMGWKKKEENLYIHEKKKLIVIIRYFGVGKVNAAYQTADLISDVHPDFIINVGFAGGLIKEAKQGDLAIGSTYVQTDFRPLRDIHLPVYAKSPKKLIMQLLKEADRLSFDAFAGKIATGDFFLNSLEQKQNIKDEFQPIAFDMESAAIAQVAAAKNTGFIAVRTFSDLADDNAKEAVERNREGKIERIPFEQRPIKVVIHTLEQLETI